MYGCKDCKWAVPREGGKKYACSYFDKSHPYDEEWRGEVLFEPTHLCDKFEKRDAESKAST